MDIPVAAQKAILSASILSSDFAHLGDEVRAVLDAGADWIHVDVMDGHFVPNLTIGPLVVGALRPIVDEYAGVQMEVHLMMDNPDDFLDEFAEAGADRLIVHVETCPHLHRTVQRIQELGVKPGVTLNPATPLVMLSEVLPLVDQVLVMSVNPGFGGQAYIPGSGERIARLREMLDAIDSEAWLSVDGGIKTHNAGEVVAAGANVLVVGSGLFNKERPVGENVAAFRRLLERGRSG